MGLFEQETSLKCDIKRQRHRQCSTLLTNKKAQSQPPIKIKDGLNSEKQCLNFSTFQMYLLPIPLWKSNFPIFI